MLNIKEYCYVLIFCIPQGSVVIDLRCGGKYDTSIVANLVLSPTVKEFLSRVSKLTRDIDIALLSVCESVRPPVRP